MAGDRPVLGWSLIVLSLGLAAVTVAAALHLGTVELVAWLAQPDVLLGILVANVALAVGRLAASAHAWRARGGRGWGAAMLLAALVLVPHVVVGWAGWMTRDTLLAVFAGPSPDPAMVAVVPAGSTTTSLPPTTTLPPPPTTTPTTISPTTISPTTIPLPPTTPPSTAPPTTDPPLTIVRPTTTTSLPFQGERLDLLLLGGDAGPGRWGLRTDTMLVGSVDTATGDAALFGLPRNYGGITFSDGRSFPGRILNEVYAYGHDHPERFDGVDPGAAAVMDVAEHLTGLDIDYFLLVDMTGFGAVVDAFGGVELTVPERVYGPLYDPVTGDYEMIHIEAGEQTLDGDQALAYARSRLDSSDYVRMGRQRCLLTAMVDTVDPVGMLAGLPSLMETIETHLTTDLPLELVPHLVRVAGNVSVSDVRVVGFGPAWSTGRNTDGYHVPDIERIRAAVQLTISDPDSAGELGVTTATQSCG